MGRIVWKPGTFEYPIPAVLVTTGTYENANVFENDFLLLHF